MATHNRADIIALAITSVLSQDDPDFELLVVADGCTDNTAEIVGGFSDPRIQFLDLPKAPFFGYANRNIAMSMAKGQYVAYAPHDDLLFPDHLRRLGDLLDQTGAGLAYSLPVWVSTDGIAVPAYSDLSFSDQLSAFHAVGNTIPANCVMHRRELYDAAGGWPENVQSAADWVLWCRILHLAGNRLSYLSTPTTLHFSAKRKIARDSGFPPLAHALSIVDQVGWWPAILRHAPVDGRCEQEAYATALSRGGLAWAEAFRIATASVVGRLAWMLLTETIPQLAASNLSREATQHALDKALERSIELESTLNVCQSHSSDLETTISYLRQMIATLEHDLGEASALLESERSQNTGLRIAVEAASSMSDDSTERLRTMEVRTLAAEAQASSMREEQVRSATTVALASDLQAAIE